ncbi:MAG: chemotaxis protein CheD [Nitrospiraceae bacterium]|nr:chemotaxis protein CheD [Nitrospiraceae bacterium]
MPGDGMPDLYMKAGEFYMSSGPARVITVLGSCVSVTMFNQRLGIGAICHALLPRNDGTGEDFRYVDSAIMRMLGAFERLNVGRGQLEAKLFGGADMFEPAGGPAGSRPARVWQPGEQNVKTALMVLEREGLRLLASDVGGRLGRKLCYCIHSDTAYIKRLDGHPQWFSPSPAFSPLPRGEGQGRRQSIIGRGDGGERRCHPRGVNRTIHVKK